LKIYFGSIFSARLAQILAGDFPGSICSNAYLV